jgi:hypothetical protein
MRIFYKPQKAQDWRKRYKSIENDNYLNDIDRIGPVAEKKYIGDAQVYREDSIKKIYWDDFIGMGEIKSKDMGAFLRAFKAKYDSGIDVTADLDRINKLCKIMPQRFEKIFTNIKPRIQKTMGFAKGAEKTMTQRKTLMETLKDGLGL